MKKEKPNESGMLDPYEDPTLEGNNAKSQPSEHHSNHGCFRRSKLPTMDEQEGVPDPDNNEFPLDLDLDDPEFLHLEGLDEDK